MADPRRLREILGFGYGAPSPAMSALQPFHAGVDPAYMPQDKVTASPGEGPSSYVRSGLESLLGLFAPSDRAAAETADKLNAVADFNPFQGAYDIGKGIGDAVQGGDKLSLAMSMIPGKAADDLPKAVKEAQKKIKAYHSTYEPFDAFDFSRLGQTTKENSVGGEMEDWATNLAQSGAWASEKPLGKQMGYPTSLDVEIGGEGIDFPSLDAMEQAVRDAGGPEAFRAKMLDQGYGHASVKDEEFGGTSYVSFSPENFSVVPAVKAAQKGIRAYHGSPQDAVSALVESAKERGVDLVMSPAHGRLVISKIVVPKEQRGQGIGSAVMQEITDYADANGMPISLSPSADFGGNKSGLARFYGRHGFESNLGRKRDFEISEAMRRYPRGGQK
jgi:GNAT superfamily N-acetyltransferase